MTQKTAYPQPKEGLTYKFTEDGRLKAPLDMPTNPQYLPLWYRQVNGLEPAPEWMTWAKPFKKTDTP